MLPSVTSAEWSDHSVASYWPMTSALIRPRSEISKPLCLA
jgi:hypothetical protein